jgi:lysophospholipase L1-like esterase
MATLPTQTPDRNISGRGISFSLVLVSLLVVCFNRIIVPDMRLDWLNIIPLAATLFLGYWLVTLEDRPYFRGRLGPDPSLPRPFGSFLLSRWVRSCLLLLLTVMALEFGFRCVSYHRSLQYERQGDLLFTPTPHQVYVEKISLTHSTINSYGLRGGPIDTTQGKQTILCLGDSITYGYGVDDNHSYPARLQSALDNEFPGRYSVLNGGVNAYPIAFEEQKFLYLWNLGLRPSVVIVGYSMNEGGPLPQLLDRSEEVKREFARRVWLKNYLRSFALYNLVAENWARRYYDLMSGKLVPGTNFAVLSAEETNQRYEQYLQRLLTDLHSRNVTPVFLLFPSFNSRAGTYNTEGPFENIFAQFAEENGIRLFRTDEMLRTGDSGNAGLSKYFIDAVHMNERGTQKLALQLAEVLPSVVEQPLRASAR